VLGSARTRNLALDVLGTAVRLPFGASIVRAMINPTPSSAAVEVGDRCYHSPVGIVIGHSSPARVRALEAIGFGFVTTGDALPTGAVRRDGTVEQVIEALDAGAKLVAVHQSVLDFGPGFAARVNDVITSPRSVEPPARVALFRPLIWPSWWWAMLVGLGMLATGLFAAAITIGPVLLGYDRAFLGTGTDGLRAINNRLVPFLQHDRITMAGCCFAIGINDVGLAIGMRRGWPWAKRAFIAAGVVGFPTFLLALGYGFFDPLHFGSAVILLCCYLASAFRPIGARQWSVSPASNERDRRRALTGQLLMLTACFGIIVSGAGIMIVGLTQVLIPSDVAYMGTTHASLRDANGHLIRFIAHDRAGFGGALASLGVGIATMVLWGWRDGERWVWWTLLSASFVGFGSAVAVHMAVGYTDVLHLAPVYLAIVMTAACLTLSRRWLTTRTKTTPRI
jgi:hypothetical protein